MHPRSIINPFNPSTNTYQQLKLVNSTSTSWKGSM